MGVDGTGDFCHIYGYAVKRMLFSKKEWRGRGGGEWETQELEQLIAE